MDSAILRQHLALADSHIALGAQHVAKQYRIIAELEAHGLDSTKAREFLEQLQQTQQLHQETRRHILKELGIGG